MAGNPITVRVDQATHRRLVRLARNRGKNESDVVREAVEAYCEADEVHNNCYELARQIGLIGCIKDAPTDLGTNPKHFEGFGR